MKIFIFNVVHMSGDPGMEQLLDKSFESREELEKELVNYRATLEKEAGTTIIDQATGTVVDSYGILNPKGEIAGALELVTTDYNTYSRLVESTGRTIGHAHERTGLRLF